jgi:two-component system, chemotaxis family, CheB/CheR fusion protein
VDEAYHVLNVSETAGRYLQVRFGPLSSSLLDLVRPELQFELREALFQAFNTNEPVVTTPVYVQFNGTPRRVTLSVRPRQRQEDAADLPEETDTGQPKARKAELETGPSPADKRLALVLFLEHKAAETVVDEDGGPGGPPGVSLVAQHEGESRTLLAQLQAETQQLRQHARAREEAYEASHEELKAANEELQSINEEYRSTTEELETSKEELQSLNEELQTVNTELKNKLAELMRAHSDLENLMAATQIATLFLDCELHIKRFTPGMEQLFNILPGDRGRPLAHLTNQLDYAALPEDAVQVLHTLQPVEREIQGQNGAWFLVRLRPYRTVDNRIDGLVITFVDITGLKQAETDLRDAKAYSETIVDTVHEGLLVLESNLKVQFANKSFLQMFQVDETQTIGKLVYHLGSGQWNSHHLRRLLEKLLPQQNPLYDYRIEYDFEEIGRRVMLLNAQRLADSDLILLAVNDITEREHYEQELYALTEQLEERVKKRTAEVQSLALQLTMAEHEERGRISQILHDDLQQQLFSIQMQLGFLHDTKNEAARDQEIQEIKEGVVKAIETTRRLSVDLSPPILQNEGLTEAIGWLSRQMCQRYRLTVKLQAEGSFPVPERDRRVLLFQMIRELLFNVVKHAGVLHVTVNLRQEEGAYRIEISDEGIGFDPEQISATGESPNHQGIANVGHQLHLIGGRLEVESTPGQGTRMTIIAPVAVPAQTPEET